MDSPLCSLPLRAGGRRAVRRSAGRPRAAAATITVMALLFLNLFQISDFGFRILLLAP